MSRVAAIVRARPHREGGFGRDDDLVAASRDGLAEDLFGHAGGVDVSRVEHVDTGFEADVDEACRFGDVRCAPGIEEFTAAAEGSGAETEDWNFESGCAEPSILHPTHYVP